MPSKPFVQRGASWSLKPIVHNNGIRVQMKDCSVCAMIIRRQSFYGIIVEDIGSPR